ALHPHDAMRGRLFVVQALTDRTRLGPWGAVVCADPHPLRVYGHQTAIRQLDERPVPVNG
ncbi:MAG: hypothetical protein COS85_01285, partial [Armatimonadetes bacterium CG07_land_8_20_14_0_80_59_28]